MERFGGVSANPKTPGPEAEQKSKPQPGQATT